MWAIMAFAKLGEGDKAGSLFSLLNPINHARTPAEIGRYKVEPYVVAADVYSVTPHVGRGWTWYTGAAGWMYRAGIEGILGIRCEGRFLVINPSFAPSTAARNQPMRCTMWISECERRLMEWSLRGFQLARGTQPGVSVWRAHGVRSAGRAAHSGSRRRRSPLAAARPAPG